MYRKKRKDKEIKYTRGDKKRERERDYINCTHPQIPVSANLRKRPNGRNWNRESCSLLQRTLWSLYWGSGGPKATE